MINIGHMVNRKERMKSRKLTYVTGVSRRYSSGIEKTVPYRDCDKSAVAFRLPFSLSLVWLLDRIGTASMIFVQSGKETRASGNGAESVGHYLLLTIFMCLSIAEISTRCDDIDWHAVKPSDMRLRRSPPTPIRPSRACVVLSRPILFLHCKRLTLYLHALPQPVLKSHAPSISISPHPRRDRPPCRAESASELPKIGFASVA